MTAKLTFFIDVSLQWKELRKNVIFWWAVEVTTYRGRCKSLLCADMTLTFEAFLGCGPIIPAPMDYSVAIDPLHGQWTILYSHSIDVP